MLSKYNDIKKVYEENGFKFMSFQNDSMAKRQLFKDISEDRLITTGGSMTIEDLNLYNELLESGNKIHWHWKGQSPGTIKQDLYLTSTNALTEDGKIINMDGNCNRVASMMYGFKDVFIIAGKNKLVKNYDEGIARIRNIAAPLNAKRLKLNTPCVKTGKCSDCDSEDRICRSETIIHRNPSTTQIHIYLIDEEIGY